MGERAFSVAQLAAAGRGRGSAGIVVGLAADDHRHEWRKLPDAVGLFTCTDRECLWCAVCPACLGAAGGRKGGMVSSPRKARAARKNAQRPRPNRKKST